MLITKVSEISLVDDNSIVIPILSSNKLHPAKDELCLLFIKNGSNEYIIPIDHPESSYQITLSEIIEFFTLNAQSIWVFDKKTFLHCLPELYSLDIYDINMLNYFDNNEALDIDNITTPAHSFYENKYRNFSKINRVIPILKHQEKCSRLAEIALKAQELKVTNSFKTYCNAVLYNLYRIEKAGINQADIIKHTEYNLYTAAGRPSNRYGGTNYAALNKDDGSRRQYWSRFKMGGMLEFDFDAYHLRLISDLINYKLPESSVHEYLGKQYFGKDTLTKEEYGNAKEISFKVLYGGIPKEFMNIEFFRKTISFINDLWLEWSSKKCIHTYLLKRPIYAKNHIEMNKQKLFNYYIQAYETEQNIIIMNDIFKVLEGYNSKLVLYTYDSFLFDFNMKDGINFMKKIKKAMKYPIKAQFGANYDDMKDVSDKI